jgi:putative DNA primase/helicase
VSPADVGTGDFLRALFGDKPADAYLLTWTLTGKRSRWFTAPDAAAAHAERVGRSDDTYFGVALSPADFGPDERCPVNQTAGLVALWADIDFLDPVHKKTNLPPTRAAARELISEAIRLAPSIVIDTGHGLQPYWLLSEPWLFESDAERDEAQDLLRRFHATLLAAAKARGWTIDNTSDLARILRVPGTTNLKDPARPAPVVVVEFAPERLYSPEDFEPYLVDLRASAAAAAAAAAPTGTLDLSDDELLERAFGFWNGTAVKALWEGDSSDHGGDDSAADQALCCHLAFLTGKDAGRIDRLFRQSKRMRDKWDEVHAADGRTYGEMTIAKGIEFTADVYRPLSAQLAAASQQHVGSNGSTPALAPARVPPVQVDEKLEPADRDFLLGCFHEEEYGDGRLLAHLYRGRLAYDHGEKAWYLWAGHSWRKDKAGLVKRLVAAQIAAQYLYLAAEVTKDAEKAGGDDRAAASRKLADKLMERARNLRKLNRAQNVINFATSLLGITGEEWDSRPTLLAVKNGVVDLTTGDLRAGDPDDYLRTAAPTDWRGLHAPCARWQTFLAEILEPIDDQDAGTRAEQTQQIVRFLQRLLGYGISGHSTEHVLPIFWGVGRNGKDTLLETLSHVLGSVAGPASTDVLLARADRSGAAQPYLYDLWGKRLVWASETNEGARLNAGQVKLVTGGGRIKTRPLWGNLVEFAPTHLLILITNAKPHAASDDYALWKRILLVAFQQRFVDNPDASKGEKQRDAGLGEQLAAEASGILAWLIRGYLAWQTKGLSPPEAVQLATKRYQEEEDTLALFIAERCNPDPGARVAGKALYDAYRDWVTGEKPMGPTAFGKKMVAKLEKQRANDGVYYLGVRLASSASPALDTTEAHPPAPKTPAGTPAPAFSTGVGVGSETPLQSQSVGCVGSNGTFEAANQNDMAKAVESLHTLHPYTDAGERETGEI